MIQASKDNQKELARIRAKTRAEALGKKYIPVAWCRYRHYDNGKTTIATCDSDADGAFQVYAAILADQAHDSKRSGNYKLVDAGPGGIDGIMVLSDQAPEAEKVEGPEIGDWVAIQWVSKVDFRWFTMRWDEPCANHPEWFVNVVVIERSADYERRIQEGILCFLK